MAEPAGVETVTGGHVLALCGVSLLLEGIEASLRDREGVEVVLVDTSQPGAVQVLDKLRPDLIVFDLTPGQLSFVFDYLRNHTDVVLIGLDLDRDLALFVSAEWHMLPTVADLIQVIEARIRVKNGGDPGEKVICFDAQARQLAPLFARS